MLELFEVPLEVRFVLEFEVEFEPETAELEPVTGGFLAVRLPATGGFPTGLSGGEERGVLPVEGGSLSLLND